MSGLIIGRPEKSESAAYYFGYIDCVKGSDILSELEGQLASTVDFATKISEDRSLYRYAPEKWSIRESLSHVNDCERLFAFRAMWFARGFETPLPSFDQDIAAREARADQIPWARHIEEFRAVRLATLTFFRNLPEDAWMRRGIASDNPFTVRAISYIIAGHLTHHLNIINERYG